MKFTATSIAIIVGFVCAFILIGVLIILGVGKPDNHNQQKYGLIQIELASSMEPYTSWSREAMENMNRIGPTFLITRSNGNVRVEFTHNGTCNNHGVANYTSSIKLIQIDLTCTHGELEFKAALMHEVGHFLGLQHICRTHEADDCVTTTHGIAVMNPFIGYSSNNEELVGWSSFPTWEIQLPDIKEYQRLHP